MPRGARTSFVIMFYRWTTYPITSMTSAWQAPDEQTNSGGTDRLAIAIAAIVAVTAVGTLALNVMQASTSPEIRELTLGVVLVLVVVLLVGVGYSPLKRSWSSFRVKSEANKVAIRNLPKLLELTRRFRTSTGQGNQESLAYAMINIQNSLPFNKVHLQRNIYFYDNMMSTIEKLAEEPMSFRLFYQLIGLFNTMIYNFSAEVQSAVNEIRSVQGYKALLRSDQVETYNLTRTYFINFLTNWREFGEKLDIELGVKKGAGVVNLSPYQLPIGYFTPPGEL